MFDIWIFSAETEIYVVVLLILLFKSNKRASSHNGIDFLIISTSAYAAGNIEFAIIIAIAH